MTYMTVTDVVKSPPAWTAIAPRARKGRCAPLSELACPKTLGRKAQKEGRRG